MIDNVDEYYFKRILYEIKTLYGEITTDNEKFEAYNNRLNVYKECNYEIKCENLLRDIAYEISYYDKVNHIRNWSITPRYYSQINKSYYLERYKELLERFNDLKYRKDNNIDIETIKYNNDVNIEFKKRIYEIIKECIEISKKTMLNTYELFLLIDNRLKLYYDEWKNNHNINIKELKFLKKVEEKYIKKLLNERLVIYIKNEIKDIKEKRSLRIKNKR